MALRQFSAYHQWQVFDQEIALTYHHSMSRWMIVYDERHTQGVRKGAIVVQIAC